MWIWKKRFWRGKSNVQGLEMSICLVGPRNIKGPVWLE